MEAAEVVGHLGGGIRATQERPDVPAEVPGYETHVGDG
jgi:hypothetical protein